MITSERARLAFDISKESPKFAEQFGNDPFEQSCLLAIRLIESGVRFVSLSLGGWDNHTDIFNALSTKQLPKLDGGLSSLLNGLEQKGLLSSTAVMVRVNLDVHQKSTHELRLVGEIIIHGACL